MEPDSLSFRFSGGRLSDEHADAGISGGAGKAGSAVSGYEAENARRLPCQRKNVCARSLGVPADFKTAKSGKLGVQFYGAIWNNLGVAYAGLFRFEQAAECFLEAYRLTKTKETFRKYISALPLFLSGKEYRKS